MAPKKIETLTWVLIYGGILGAILGWFVAPADGPWGELLIAGGGAAVVGGLALIIVRSRMKDPS